LFALPPCICQNIGGKLNCAFRHALAKPGSIYIVERPPKTSEITGLDYYDIHSPNDRSFQVLILCSYHGQNRYFSFEGAPDWPQQHSLF
jgi:hypothetical protein